ncbi:protein FAM171A1 isoform X1 [Paramormyrops kingsleyae]|uniref:protein FAM171A1 isoform X1 n=1 Tax=Paramormyrops kingsleyae TaxID=1676925 RepID=UPI003B96DCFB
MNRSAAIVLCLLGCNVWKAVTKSLPEDGDAREVTLKVRLSDAGTHQPITGVTVEIFANHTSLASESSGPDGNAYVTFPYRVGSLLIVTATKPGYVPNSAPWRPARMPVFSSLSLELLPEKAAALMVYEDVVHIVSGFPGSTARPWVQFRRRALNLPPDTNYANLTAQLTVASSARQFDLFPYLQGLSGNGTGNGWELNPITAISVHLLGDSGAEVHVSEPISIMVPLPPDSGLKENDHIPAWRFDPKLGAWLKSSLGYVQREGGQLVLTYIAPQLGYWAAAMSPLNTGAVVAKDISSYHTAFLLAILGGMGVIILFLASLLLYYCRRKCLRPRQRHHKLQLSTVLSGSKRDQATSMSHLNLISEVHLDLVSSTAEPNLHTPVLQPTCAPTSHQEREPSNQSSPAHQPHSSRTSLVKECHRLVEVPPVRAARSQELGDGYESPRHGDGRQSRCSESSPRPPDAREGSAQASRSQLSVGSEASIHDASLSRPRTPGPTEQPPDRRPVDHLLSRSVDHLERPASLPRPGQLLCCSSVDQVNEGGYRRARPTLVIPAHYVRLPGEHPFAGQPLLLQADQQSDLETIQAELSASQPPPGPPGSGTPQMSSSTEDPRDGTWTLQTASAPESLSIPASLSEVGLVQMNGEDQLLAEKSLLELRGGKPLPHPRAWFVSLDGRSNAHIRHSYIDLQRAGCNGSNDASLDSGVDMSELARRIRRGLREREAEREAEVEARRDRSTPPTVAYTQLVYVDDMEADGSETGTPNGSPDDGALGPLLQDTRGAEEEEVDDDGGGRGEGEFRTEHARPELQLPDSPPDIISGQDDSGEDENKKSPWQKREERPLLAFNLK